MNNLKKGDDSVSKLLGVQAGGPVFAPLGLTQNSEALTCSEKSLIIAMIS